MGILSTGSEEETPKLAQLTGEEKCKHFIDNYLWPNLETAMELGIKRVEDTEDNIHGFIVDSRPHVTDPVDGTEPLSPIRMVKLYNPVTGETFWEPLHRVYGRGNTQELVVLENDLRILTELVQYPGPIDHNDPEAFNSMVKGRQARKFRETKRNIQRLMDEAEEANAEAKRLMERNNRLHDELEAEREEKRELKALTRELSDIVVKSRTTMEEMVSSAAIGEKHRKKESAKTREEIEEAPVEGAREGMSGYKKFIEDLRDLEEAADGVSRLALRDGDSSIEAELQKTNQALADIKQRLERLEEEETRELRLKEGLDAEETGIGEEEER